MAKKYYCTLGGYKIWVHYQGRKIDGIYEIADPRKIELNVTNIRNFGDPYLDKTKLTRLGILDPEAGVKSDRVGIEKYQVPITKKTLVYMTPQDEYAPDPVDGFLLHVKPCLERKTALPVTGEEAYLTYINGEISSDIVCIDADEDDPDALPDSLNLETYAKYKEKKDRVLVAKKVGKKLTGKEAK